MVIGMIAAGLGGPATSTIKKSKKQGTYSPGKSGLPGPGRSGQQSSSTGTGVPRDNSRRTKATTRKKKTKAAEKPLTQIHGYRMFGGK